MTHAPALEVKDLTLGYSRDKPIVQNLSFSLEKGSYTVLAGPSGCGKTTLAQFVARVLKPNQCAIYQGNVLVNGKNFMRMDSTALAAQAAFVWQSPDAQMCAPSIVDEARLPLLFQNADFNDATARAQHALETVGLGYLSHSQDPLILSGGEQQRLALAAALVQGAHLLILDEPTSALDEQARNQFCAALHSVRAHRDITVLAIDHFPHYHAGLAQRLLVMNANGSVMLDGDFDQLLHSHKERIEQFGVRTDNGYLTGECLFGKVPRKHEVKPDSNSRLRMKDLSLGFGDPLITDLSLSLSAGDLLLVRGNNGSGKSTLLGAIAGQIDPLNGEISPPLHQRLKSGIAWVTQRSTQIQRARSVGSQVALSASANKIQDFSSLPATKQEQLEQMLRAQRLWDCLEMHPMNLSGGMRQRLRIVSALASEAEIILLDEPTSAQDGLGMNALVELINENRDSRVFCIVTHDDVFAQMLKPTQVLQLGEPRQTVDSRRTEHQPLKRRTWFHPLVYVVALLIATILTARNVELPQLLLSLGILSGVGIFQAVLEKTLKLWFLAFAAVLAFALISWLGFLGWVQVLPDDPLLAYGHPQATRLKAALPALQFANFGLAFIALAPLIRPWVFVDWLVDRLHVPYRFLDIIGFAPRFMIRLTRDTRLAMHQHLLMTKRKRRWFLSVDMFVPVLVASLQYSELLADALDGKGFGIEKRRTTWRERNFTLLDAIVVCALLSLIFF